MPKKDKQKVQSLIQAGEAAVKFLTQVDAAALWKNSLRESEVRTRLTKATQAKSDLEQQESTLPENSPSLDKVKKAIGALSVSLAEIPFLQDMMAKLRGKKLAQDLENEAFQDELVSACKSSSMDADTLSAILLFIGQKTAEAGFPKSLCQSKGKEKHIIILTVAFFENIGETTELSFSFCLDSVDSFSSQAKPNCLLKLVSTSESFKGCYFSFASLFNISDQVDRVLLRCQMTIIHNWADSLRNATWDSLREIFATVALSAVMACEESALDLFRLCLPNQFSPVYHVL